MLGYKGAEHENEQVVEDDVVQPVYEGVVQERRVRRRRPDIAGIKIEDDVGCEQQRKRRERRLFHLPEQTAPKRHEKVKPQQDDEKVYMIHSQAVPQGFHEGQRLKQVEIVAENGYVQHVKQGPGDIGDKDRPQAAAQVVFVGKGLVQGLAAEHAEGRQEEEGRYGKPRQDFQYGDEP